MYIPRQINKAISWNLLHNKDRRLIVPMNVIIAMEQKPISVKNSQNQVYVLFIYVKTLIYHEYINVQWYFLKIVHEGKYHKLF